MVTVGMGEAAQAQVLCPLALQVRRVTGGLVGRPVELAALEQELATAASGRLACVIVEGEPGIGKTRLLLAAQDLAAEHGFEVIPITADEELRGPFLVARSMLACRPAQELAAGTHAQSALNRAVNALLGEDDPALAGLPSKDKLMRTYDLGALALRELAALRPLAILLDDGQWADEDSLRLLRYVVRANADSAILLLLAVRPEETALVNELVTLAADLDRAGYLRRLRLQRFTQAESGEMVRRVLGGEVHSGTIGTMHVQAEGVPFILEALATSYRDGGMIQQIDGAWMLAANAHRLVPSAVHTLIQRRALRLPEATRSLLGDAAVVGRSFSLRDMQAVRSALDGGSPELAELTEAIKPAVAAGLLAQQAVESPADYSFSHEQVRAFALSTLPATRRRAVHAAIVELLGGSGEPAPESLPMLAHHAREAGNAELSARFAIEATRAARERNAPDEMLRLVEQGLPAVTDATDRMTLLLLRDEAFGMLRRTDERLDAIAEMAALADALGDRRMELEVMLRRSAAMRASDDHQRAAQIAGTVRRRARDLGDGRIELLACLEQGQAALRSPLGEGYVPVLREIDADEARQAFERATELAQALGDERMLAAAHRELGVVSMAHARQAIMEMYEAGEVPQDLLAHEPMAVPFMDALGRFQQALELYERIGDKHGVMSCILSLAYATWGAEFRLFGSVRRLEETRRLAARLKTLTTESDRDLAELHLLYGIHAYARDFGTPDLALARGEEAYHKARAIAERMVEFLAAGGMALTHMQFEDVDSAQAWLDRAAAAAAVSATPLKARQLELWRGRCAATAGDAADSRSHLTRAIQFATQQGRAPARCEAQALLALTLARLGAEARDEQLLDEAARVAEHTIELAAGLPGRPPWRAQANAALAFVSMARGNPEAALRHARATLEELDASEQEELFLDLLLPCARAVLAAGTEEEREAIRSRLALRLGEVVEYTLDADVQARWFAAEPQRELVAIAGGVDAALAAFRSSPMIAAYGSMPTSSVELSDQERAFLRLMTEGETDEGIAARSGVPKEQVARQLSDLFTRMGAPSRAAATAFAFVTRMV